MTSTALLMVLAAAVFHALWNLAAKRVQGNGFLFVWWYNVFSALLWFPIGLVMLAQAGWPLSWHLLVGPIISAVLHVVYQLSLQTGYDKADLNVVYPVARGVGPMLTMLVAIMLLGERPGVMGAVGGLVVIVGIVVVASGPRPHGSRIGPGLLWGGLTGTGIAAYTLWDDHAMSAWGLLPVTYFATSCVFQVAMMSPALPRATKEMHLGAMLRRHWREVAVVAVLSPLAYILVLQAMRTVPVSLVAPARETSIVVGSLLAWLLFKEPNPARRLLGAAVVLVGITLIVV